MYAAERDLYRVLYSMAQLDPDSVGGAVQKMDQERREAWPTWRRRLDEAGLLRPDVSVADATNVLWMLCSFENFDLLHTGRRLSVNDTTELIVTTAERALFR